MAKKRTQSQQPDNGSTATAAPPGDVWEPLIKLDRDLRQASRLLGREQIRYLVDQYYALQEFRKAAANQSRAAGDTEGKDAPEPSQVIDWLWGGMASLENNIKRALYEFCDEYAVGRWMMSIVGVGPCITAGMLSHLDIRRAKTAGHFWNFAGLNPDTKWIGAAESRAIVDEIAGDAKKVTPAHLLRVAERIKRPVDYLHRTAKFLTKKDEPAIGRDLLARVLSVRPWNAKLKRLVWVFGDVQNKFQNHEESYYGPLMQQRRAYADRKNAEGGYKYLADAALASGKYKRDTKAKASYEEGKLSDGQLHAQTLRWIGKIFLSHVHHAMYMDYYGQEPPVPYAFTLSDHRHFHPLPNFPWTGGGKRLGELLR